MSLIDVPLTTFLANFVTMDTHPKVVEHLAADSAVFACPDCKRRVKIATSPLAAPDALNQVADGNTLYITANPTPEYAQATACADRVWDWLNS